MTSLLTNTAAMTSLQALTATQRQLSRTQAQVSSGLAVANASDNAAYWSIGQTMSAQVAGLGAVNRGLALTLSIADVTAAALSSIKGSLDRIQADVVTAGQAGVDKAAVQSDVVAQQQSILAIANSASFNGVNWLIDHTSTSTSTTLCGESNVSASDLRDIALGVAPQGAQSVYHAKTTTTTTRTDGGSTETEVSTSGQTYTKTSDGDGTETPSPTTYDASTDVVSGFTDVDHVVVPMSVSSNGGLMTTSFSLAPLVLFSDNAGTSTYTASVSYHGAPPVTVLSYLSTSASSSYDGYGASAASGILDGSIFLTIPVPATGAGSKGPSTGPSSPVYVFDPSTGGNVLQTAPASTNGGGATYETISENILTLSVVNTSASDLATMQKMLRAAITGIIGASTTVGAIQTQLSTQMSYNSALSDALTSGVGSLVDADMNVASTRLQALQTQQQLGIQALSMANQNSQLILKLFQAA